MMHHNTSNKKGPILLLGASTVEGGSARVFLEEGSYFAKSDFDTYMLAFCYDAGAFNCAYGINVEVIGRKFHSNNSFVLNRDRLIRILKLRKRIKEIKPAVIITHNAMGCFILYLATLFTPFPYVTYIYQTIFWSETRRKTFMEYAWIHRKVFSEIRESVPERKQFLPLHPKMSLRQRIFAELMAIAQYIGVRKAKKIFVFSNQMRWEVSKIHNKDAVVLNGVGFHPWMFNYTPKQDIKQKLDLTEKKMILSVCNLIPKKRVDLLLKAFARICNKLENTVLVIGGEGPEKKRLEEMAQELGIVDRVKVVGYIPEYELWDYYAASDVCAHLDSADFAISAYEPLAFQKKVIWSCECKNDPIVAQNRHIFTVEPTVDDIAATLERALNADIEEENDLSDFTWDAFFGNIVTEILPIVRKID
jgi:glycosyltransferase involved in cell wall biosynthesis